MRVGVQGTESLLWRSGAHRIDMAHRMHPEQIIIGDKRCLDTHQPVEFIPPQNGKDMFQPRHLLGMAGRCDVAQAIVMRDQCGGQSVKSLEYSRPALARPGPY